LTPGQLGRLLATRDAARLDAALAGLDPASPHAVALHAEVLRRARREAEAAPLFARACAALPDVLPLLHVAALADVALGRHASACTRWEAFVERAPNVAGAWLNLGLARAALGRDDAVTALDRAAEFDARDPQPLARAAAIFGERAALPEAIERLDRAIALAPDDAALRFARAAHRSSLALHANALDDLRAAVALAPHDAAGASALLVELHYDEALAGPEQMFAEHRAWAARHAAVPAIVRARRASGPPRLRIGYLSPRFGDAPLAALLTPVLESHDRSRFETIAYAAYPVAGSTAQRVRAAVDRWVDLPRDDGAAFAAIAEDDLDLLVDLAGHAPGNRLPLLSRRPARVQTNWLDWFDTTGVPAIDWLIGDAIHTPARECHRFTERLLLLPGARFAYRPPVPVAPSVPPSLHNGYVTFGSNNRHAKLTDAVAVTWARVLRAVPGSRLVLRAAAYNAPSTVAFVRERWAQLGVPVGRVAFEPHVPLDELHRAYAGIDVALDPFPFCGGVTTCDALAHGVPVVTLCGDRMIARQGAALLAAAGRPQWVAPDVDAYVAIAAALADPRTLAREREVLAQSIGSSALFDVARFTRVLERGYVAMVSADPGSREPLAVGADAAAR
jgi:predicted O-linked N-acetylglucosamine transferase (SPINDLY family)